MFKDFIQQELLTLLCTITDANGVVRVSKAPPGHGVQKKSLTNPKMYPTNPTKKITNKSNKFHRQILLLLPIVVAVLLLLVVVVLLLLVTVSLSENSNFLSENLTRTVYAVHSLIRLVCIRVRWGKKT